VAKGALMDDDDDWSVSLPIFRSVEPSTSLFFDVFFLWGVGYYHLIDFQRNDPLS
jgi:hypothetical protein